jgi:cell division protein FtsZ
MINPVTLPQRTVIKVIGLGGGGCNAIDRMIQVGIGGIDYVAANTDVQALARCDALVKIHLGPGVTRGLGAGGQPGVGERAAEESYDQLAQALVGADMVFLTAGMGGGTGTGAIPVAARAAREVGALTLAVVTLPFAFEGTTRARNARQGIVRLREHVHTLITVPNDRLLQITPRDMRLDIAFRVADDVLRQGVQGIAELVTRPGLINLDFAHVRRLIRMSGGAVLAVGHAQGPGKAVMAARRALAHPLLDVGAIAHAAGILVHFTGGPDLGLLEVNDAVDLIRAEASPGIEIVFGATVDELMSQRAQAILVATGVGARPLSEVFGHEAAEAIVRRRATPTPVDSVPEEDLPDWPADELQQVAPRRDSLDVPAFLRRRALEPTRSTDRLSDADM